MPQPILALQHRSGAAPQVYSIPGASPLPVGDPIGVAIEAPGNNSATLYNRAVQFRGDLYAAVNGGVYKKDDPTTDVGPWSLDHAFTNVTTTATMKHAILGLYQFTENGTSKLFVCWLTDTSAATWNASILNGSTNTWSDVGEQAAATVSAGEALGQQIVYRSVFYALLATSNTILTFDPSAGSLGAIASGTTDLQTAALGIFNDRLLLLGTNNATGDIGLHEVGSAVTLLVNVPAYSQAGIDANSRTALFPSPDGSVLYGIAPTTTGGNGHVFLKFIDTSGTLSLSADLTTPVLPAGLRPGAGTATARFWAHYDQETTPGTAIGLIFYAVDGTSGSTVTQFRFVDEVTELLQEDIGGSAAWAFSSVTTGGGERIFTPGELHIEIVERLAVFGGEAIRFMAWGASGADKNVDFRFNSQNEVPLSTATLIGTPTVVSGAAPAPTRNVNVLEDVTADGATIYQVIWDVGTDGFVAGQRAQLVPRVYI